MRLPPAYAHQTRTLDAVRRAYLEGARRICVVAPTGGGKTWIGSAVVDGGIRKGRRVLWLAHREELVDQAAASLSRLGVPHGVIKAGRPAAPDAPIQVASVQTLVARPHELPPADLIVADETHHAVAATWRALLGRYPSPELVLGLTATPERGDRKPLGEASGGVYQRLVAVTSVAELQRTARPDGSPILVPCRVVGPRAYQQELFRSPVDGLVEFARGADGRLRRSILFAASVEDAERIAAEACSRGIRAASVDGKLATAERRARLQGFARGELELLTNVMVLTEGFDVPATEVCAIARGCAASSTFLQMVGRALRSSPETGKREALLVDYRGLSHVHGLVDEDRTYSLEGRAISRPEKTPLRQCPRCGAVFAPTPKCPGCGAPTLAAPRERQRVKRAEAVELNRDTVTPMSQRRAAFDRLVETARARGYKAGWVGVQFKNRFGMWPPWPVAVGAAQKGAA